MLFNQCKLRLLGLCVLQAPQANTSVIMDFVVNHSGLMIGAGVLGAIIVGAQVLKEDNLDGMVDDSNNKMDDSSHEVKDDASTVKSFSIVDKPIQFVETKSLVKNKSYVDNKIHRESMYSNSKVDDEISVIAKEPVITNIQPHSEPKLAIEPVSSVSPIIQEPVMKQANKNIDLIKKAQDNIIKEAEEVCETWPKRCTSIYSQASMIDPKVTKDTALMISDYNTQIAKAIEAARQDLEKININNDISDIEEEINIITTQFKSTLEKIDKDLSELEKTTEEEVLLHLGKEESKQQEQEDKKLQEERRKKYNQEYNKKKEKLEVLEKEVEKEYSSLEAKIRFKYTDPTKAEQPNYKISTMKAEHTEMIQQALNQMKELRASGSIEDIDKIYKDTTNKIKEDIEKVVTLYIN